MFVFLNLIDNNLYLKKNFPFKTKEKNFPFKMKEKNFPLKNINLKYSYNLTVVTPLKLFVWVVPSIEGDLTDPVVFNLLLLIIALNFVINLILHYLHFLLKINLCTLNHYFLSFYLKNLTMFLLCFQYKQISSRGQTLYYLFLK